MNASTGYDVVVVGGGPGGSTVATYMAMNGYRVKVLEKEHFPRHRIGESLLPSMMPVLQDFGLIETVESFGWPKKTGGTFIWGASEEPWDVLFGENPFLPFPHTFHVERGLFDKMLLDHAAEVGCEVEQGATVTGALMDGEQVVGVQYTDDSGEVREARGRFVIDASGPACVIGRKLTKRSYDERMKQVAFYTYYKGAQGPRNFRENHVIVTSAPKGWFWWIPMGDSELGDASVGLVSGQEFKDEYTAKGIEAFFAECYDETPYIQELLGPDAVQTQPMRAITDWAYTCDRMAGPGFFLVGDSACFLDPMLSTGVSMAMLSGYSAAACMRTILEAPEHEAGAVDFYNQNYQRMWQVSRDFLHYFYAGNSSAKQDEIFWQARSMLKLGDNVGAKQAFCFMVNTIPSNPHPALRKQIHMFQQFMDHIEHPLQAMEGELQVRGVLGAADGWIAAEDLDGDTIPVVNGELIDTFVIDGERRALQPIRGLAYDMERPIFSSTASWLLGRNVHPLDAADADLLVRLDGQRTWKEVVAAHAAATGDSVEAAGEALTARLTRLWDERIVLLRVERRLDAA